QGGEEIAVLHLLQRDSLPRHRLLGVEQRVGEGEPQLLDAAGSLQVPEERQDPAVRARQIIHLLEERRLADPAQAGDPQPELARSEKLCDLGLPPVEPRPADPLADDEGDGRRDAHRSSSASRASTSARVIVRRPSSCRRWTRARHRRWIWKGFPPESVTMRSAAPAAKRNMPRTGSSTSRAASSGEIASTWISSKKLYQGLVSFSHSLRMRTPATTAARFSAKRFMNRLRR